MAAIDLSAQRVVLTKTDTPLKPGAVVKPQILLATLLQSLGFSSITIGTTAPGDQESLWYNKDNNTFRRYNPLTSTWAVLVPAQWIMHLLQTGIKAAGVEALADNADKLPFLDVSANEPKAITIADLKASLGVTGWVQYGNTITLGAPASSVEFDLPTAYTDFLLRATFTANAGGGGPAYYHPRVRGVYPTNAIVDLSAGLSGTFAQVDTQERFHHYTGDRGDLTGYIRRVTGWQWGTIEALNVQATLKLTNRISKVRFLVPDGALDGEPSASWQFQSGSVFKLFVR